MSVAQVDGVQNVEGTQADVHVRFVDVEVIACVQIEQSVGRDLPRLTPFVFAVQAERIKVCIVAAEDGETRLDVDFLVVVLQRDTVLALRRVTHRYTFRIVLNNSGVALGIDVGEVAVVVEQHEAVFGAGPAPISQARVTFDGQ